jgi:lipoprotein-anchoring transpeptidase ErfK/SrfK
MPMAKRYQMVFILILATTFASPVFALDADQVNAAQPPKTTHSSIKLDAFVTKLQILLDRAHFSPGQIDGKTGENVEKAIAAFAEVHRIHWESRWTPELWHSLTDSAPDNLFVNYTTTDADLRGPFLRHLPAKMEEMEGLRGLYYLSPRQELAERFHVSEQLLSTLNPEARFEQAGESLVLPNVAGNRLGEKIAHIIVDKSAQTVSAFDSKNNLVAFFPATVGSDEKPAPSGRLKVTVVKKNPTYHYNPKYHFKGVKTDKPFTIKSGPNNPVGLAWIGLTGEGYGIHGTPDPDKVSKTASHGCVRLTNWDAVQLALSVRKCIPVDFVDGK